MLKEIKIIQEAIIIRNYFHHKQVNNHFFLTLKEVRSGFEN